MSPVFDVLGCLYFVLKHFADRHNLAYVYARSKISKKVRKGFLCIIIFYVLGCLYFVLKHFADRHNLAYVYARSKISKKVREAAKKVPFLVARPLRGGGGVKAWTQKKSYNNTTYKYLSVNCW